MSTIYITRSDIENIFGTLNVIRWADLDGDDDATKIGNRISYAIATACANFDDVIRGHQYANVIVNATLIDLVARMAALRLYDGREIIDGDPTTDKLSLVRQDVESRLYKIRRGEITIEGERATAIPQVVPVDELASGSHRPESPFYGLFKPNIPF